MIRSSCVREMLSHRASQQRPVFLSHKSKNSPISLSADWKSRNLISTMRERKTPASTQNAKVAKFFDAVQQTTYAVVMPKPAMAALAIGVVDNQPLSEAVKMR